MNAYDFALKAIQFEETERVPVVLWAIGQSYAPFARIPDNEYYADPARMLEAQLEFHEYFGDIFTVPGLWPDFGAVPELGAFGGSVEFPTDAPPQIRKAPLEDIAEAETIVLPDPRCADYTSQVLDYLKYFKKNAPQKLLREYSYLDGHLFCMGPGELSALMLGYDKFFYAIYDRPELVHMLCRKVTDFSKDYLSAQMEIVGAAKRVIIVDHSPGMISAPVYKEFVHPYLSELFDFVRDAEIRLYHNENNYPHLVDIVKNLQANVCHVGPKHNLTEDKKNLAKCMMGNIDPIGELLQGSVEEVGVRCRKIISAAGQGGGLWLSTGGGMAPETPIERIKLLLEIASETPIS